MVKIYYTVLVPRIIGKGGYKHFYSFSGLYKFINKVVKIEWQGNKLKPLLHNDLPLIAKVKDDDFNSSIRGRLILKKTGKFTVKFYDKNNKISI